MSTDAFPADVTVAIVAHNAANTLPGTVASVRDAGCPAERIIVVDVASTDGAPQQVARGVPGIRVRRLDVNWGPGPGRNVGLLDASTRFVFLMDADVTVEPQTIAILHAAMAEDPRIAIGSPIVVHADRPEVIQYAGTGFHFICEAVNPWLDRPLVERGSAPEDIGAASTCALLIARKPAIDVGLFDERYFIGKEDGDFTHRVVMAGYRMVEIPLAIVRHRSRPRGDWLFYYQIRNRWHVILKDYQLRTIVLLLPALAVHEILQAMVLLLRGYGLTYLRAVGGLIAMLPQLPADRAAVARVRVRADRDLLRDDLIVARGDLIGSGLARTGARLYQSALRAYWRLIRPALAR
jgi:hypothetical protein